MNLLTKTTINFAHARALDVTIHNLNSDNGELWIWEAEEDMEPLIIYTAKADGSFFYKVKGYLNSKIREELPYWIKNEKHLREVLNFIGHELKIDRA